MNRRYLSLFLLVFAFGLSVISLPAPVRAVDAAVEEAQFVLARDLYGMGKYSGAIREFGRLLFDFESKRFADACHFYIGSSHYATGDYDKAVEQLGLVVEKYRDSPYRAPSLYLMARAEYFRNRLREAISDFASYEKEYAGQDRADDSLYWKGKAYLGLEAREKARESFTELLKQYPDGNKADAARFELRLMELEDKAARGGGEDLRGGILEELKRALAVKETEIENLKGEVATLRASNEKGREERENEIRGKIEALVSLESLLAVKEKALNEKERMLKEVYQSHRKKKGGEKKKKGDE